MDGPSRARLGRFGEALAAAFVAQRGGIILGRNLRVGRSEIDVLAAIGGERVAIEVKTAAFQRERVDPAASFDSDQAQRVRDAARELHIRRVDLICVMVGPTGVEIRWSPRAA